MSTMKELEAWTRDFMSSRFAREYNEWDHRPFGFRYDMNWQRGWMSVTIEFQADGKHYSLQEHMNLLLLMRTHPVHRRQYIAHRVRLLRRLVAVYREYDK